MTKRVATKQQTRNFITRQGKLFTTNSTLQNLQGKSNKCMNDWRHYPGPNGFNHMH